jgi:hypothetical protein
MLIDVGIPHLLQIENLQQTEANYSHIFVGVSAPISPYIK